MNSLPKNSIEYAKKLDREDPIAGFREQFHIPLTSSGKECVYFCGNSLGLQPRKAKEYVEQEMMDWSRLGVRGHSNAKNPWVHYHEFLTSDMAEIVGAREVETVVMNSLTVNLHLLMVSFYRPTKQRYKILIEYAPFPSDRFAVESQARFHGYDPTKAIIELTPDENDYVDPAGIEKIIAEKGDEIALILIGGVNYYSGQAYPLKQITEWGHAKGCTVGFDLAHAAGNLELKLHDDGPDFAAWCSYKYLNSGPGSLSGVFIHERYARNFDLPRFAGWWSHNKKTRFNMHPQLDLMEGAEGWQLSNPPILPMATMRASLEIFRNAGMPALRKKSLRLNEYLRDLLSMLENSPIKIITPGKENERGCQLSLQLRSEGKELFDKLTRNGVITDWREPDVIRIAPAPLYNSYEDVYNFYRIMKDSITG